MSTGPAEFGVMAVIAMGPNGPKGCVDVNECESGLSKCVGGQECVNKIGSYSCTNNVDPFNKCGEGQHECHPLAVCTPNVNNKKGRRY